MEGGVITSAWRYNNSNDFQDWIIAGKRANHDKKGDCSVDRKPVEAVQLHERISQVWENQVDALL